MASKGPASRVRGDRTRSYQAEVLAPIGLAFDHVVDSVDDWQRVPPAARGTTWSAGCDRTPTRVVQQRFSARAGLQ